MAICERCGREVYTDYAVRTDAGKEWWCDECVEDNAFRCGICGLLYSKESDHFTVDGADVCGDCFENECVQCEICGEVVRDYNATYVEDEEGYVCDSCINDHFIECAYCGELVRRDNATYVEEEDGYVCDECIRSYYTRCDSCGEYVRDDHMHSHRGNLYCSSCYDDLDFGFICSYHDGPDIEYYGYYTGEFKGVGTELEVDDGYDPESCAEELSQLYPDGEIYFTQDGSLSDDGFEIVTQPHTYEAFMNIDWEGIVKVLEKYNYKSHDTTTCGLHVHLSRTLFGETKEIQEDNIAKVVKFYDDNYEDMFKVSRRKRNECHWAEDYMSTDDVRCFDNIDESKKEYKNLVKKRYISRYRAVNVTNHDTIEFRLAKGTLNIASLKAWVNLHFLLVKNSHKIPWNRVDDLNLWFKGIDEDNLNIFRKSNAFTSYMEAR